MNWFRKQREKTEKIDAGSSILDPRGEHRASNFNAFLLLFLVFFTGILFLGTSILQSAPTTSTQSNWAGGLDGGAPGTLDNAWTKYSAKETGVVAGEDIQLQSIDYLAIQTTEWNGQGANPYSANTTPNKDECTSGSCLIGGGFGAGTSTATNAAVSGTGSGVSGRLDIFLTKTLDKCDNFIHKG